MRKNILRPITILLSIEVSVIWNAKVNSYVFYNQLLTQAIGILIDINEDNNFKFFTSFCIGNLPDNFVVLLNKEDIIKRLKSGQNKVTLKLQFHEKVCLSSGYNVTIPKKDNKTPDLILIGEIREKYYLFRNQKSKRWEVYYFNYWGKLLEPKNPFDYWN